MYPVDNLYRGWRRRPVALALEDGARGLTYAVHECIVLGVPDPKWGERVEAAIQLKPGLRFDEAELVAFLKDRVGSVKTPKKIHVAETLPKSAVGKVLRREARRLFAPGA